MGLTKPIEQYLFSNLLTKIHIVVYLKDIIRGGVFEKFEKQITGVEENTDNDLIYAFLDYVLSDNRNREKLKELTEIHLKEKEISLEENPNFKEENANDDFEELTEEE